jgi:DNA-directed RNA polymerase specialized sigma24 family protein
MNSATDGQTFITFRETGNIALLEQLRHRYTPDMLVGLKRFFGDDSKSCRAVVDETWAKLDETRDRVDPHRTFVSTLYSVMVNLAIDHLRRKGIAA